MYVHTLLTLLQVSAIQGSSFRDAPHSHSVFGQLKGPFPPYNFMYVPPFEYHFLDASVLPLGNESHTTQLMHQHAYM